MSNIFQTIMSRNPDDLALDGKVRKGQDERERPARHVGRHGPRMLADVMESLRTEVAG